MDTFTHTAFDTEFGPVALAATGVGIVRCNLPGSDPDSLVDEVIARTGLAPQEGGELVDEAAEQVIAFLEGDLREFDVDLDWQLTRGFHRLVLQATTAVPYGETASYGEVAALAGAPGAARAAGTALSRNPIALMVPCHRIIKSDGKTGGYGGGAAGTDLKQKLLDLEVRE
ncbi:MAG: methylated-DNA--[protein]-cysteine S-methyltransferase [Solirubrobacterales bacterium]|nr:methylated-DNA--[protein]-cysteine S-methyltransferase [Solirubrobacterales bacterium]HMT04706.1 methylated-DNA--[protein]-cysteine S-methyltransferase [Solirubrobacterales bacterium]